MYDIYLIELRWVSLIVVNIVQHIGWNKLKFSSFNIPQKKFNFGYFVGFLPFNECPMKVRSMPAITVYICFVMVQPSFIEVSVPILYYHVGYEPGTCSCYKFLFDNRAGSSGKLLGGCSATATKFCSRGAQIWIFLRQFLRKAQNSPPQAIFFWKMVFLC